MGNGDLDKCVLKNIDLIVENHETYLILYSLDMTERVVFPCWDRLGWLDKFKALNNKSNLTFKQVLDIINNER